jgi:hypothetical protein
MSNVIRVTVLNHQDQTLQTEDDDGRNIVHEHADPQPITWELDVLPKSAGFTKGTSPPPIEWLGQGAPTGTFGTPHLSRNDRTLRVLDHNHDAATAGTFPYRLSAEINGLIYQTVPKSLPPPALPQPPATTAPAGAGGTTPTQTGAPTQAQPTSAMRVMGISDPVIINR